MSTKPSPDKRLARLHTSLKIFSIIVLAIIFVTIIYAIVIAVKNWSHIGV